MIVLTAKRRTQKRGFKGTLHVCKLSQGRYQVLGSNIQKPNCKLQCAEAIACGRPQHESIAVSSGWLASRGTPLGLQCCRRTHTLTHASHALRQVRKSVRLKLLTKLEAFIDSPGQQEYLELTFVQVGRAGVTHSGVPIAAGEGVELGEGGSC